MKETTHCQWTDTVASSVVSRRLNRTGTQGQWSYTRSSMSAERNLKESDLKTKIPIPSCTWMWPVSRGPLDLSLGFRKTTVGSGPIENPWYHPLRFLRKNYCTKWLLHWNFPDFSGITTWCISVEKGSFPWVYFSGLCHGISMSVMAFQSWRYGIK